MAENTTDRRVRKTRGQLRQGLVRLMREKSIQDITVKELCEECDINRGTFYLHYTDVYQLLHSHRGRVLVEFEARAGRPDGAVGAGSGHAQPGHVQHV